MKATVTIPEQVREPEVIEFRVNPGSPIVKVIILDPVKGKQIKFVDITSDWQAATATKKSTMKAFFRIIGINALDQLVDSDGIDVTTNEVTGDLFDIIPES